MFACDCLLGFLLADVVGLGGNQGDKLDTAFHEQVTRIFREGLAGRWGQDLCDDLLDRRYCRQVSEGRSNTLLHLRQREKRQDFEIRRRNGFVGSPHAQTRKG